MLMYLHSHYYLTFGQLLRYFWRFWPFSPFIHTPSCLNCDENWWHWFFYTEFVAACIVVFALALLSALMSDLGWQIENQRFFSFINKIDSHVDFSPIILVARLCLFYIFLYIIKLIHAFCIDIIVWPFCPILPDRQIENSNFYGRSQHRSAYADSNEEVHAQAWENLFVRRHECVVQHVLHQRDCGLTRTTSGRPNSQSGN